MKTQTLTRPVLVALATLTALATMPLPAAADPIPASASAPAPAPAPAPPPPDPAVSRKTVALGAAGVAVAGAIGATAFGVLALQNKSDYEKTPTYANTDNGNNFAAYSDGCIALAAAAGITSLVLFLTSSASVDGAGAPAKHASTIDVSPVVMAHGGGAGIAVTF